MSAFPFLRSERFRRLSKEGFWVVAGQLIAVLGTLAGVRILTELLDPSQYGELALGLTVATLVNQVIMGGITAGIKRFYSIAVEKHDLYGYMRDSCKLLGYATLSVVVVGLVLMAGLLWLGYSHWMGFAAAALVFSLLSGFNSTFNGIQNAARKRAIVAFHGGLDAWLKILLAVAVIFWLGTASIAVVIGYSCSSLLVTVSQLFFLRRTIPREGMRSEGHTQFIQQMWVYSWPFSVWGIFTWTQQVSDRWALQTYGATADVGHYAVLFQLGYTPIAMATGMAMSFLGPILWQRAGDATDHHRNANVHKLAWRMTYLGLFLTLLGFVITLVLHGWLFRFLVSPEYRASSYLLPWVVLAGGIFTAGQMLAMKLLCEMKSAAMTSAKIITAVMGILFNVTGAVLAGMQGVVAALVAFSVVYFIWMAILARFVYLDAHEK